MSNLISLEDAFKIIAADYRKKARWKVFRMTLGCGIIPAFFLLIAICAFVAALMNQKFSPFMAGLALLGCAIPPSVLIYVMIRDERNRKQYRLTILKESPESFFCASELEKYGFYELALKVYDKCLEKQFKESRKRTDELASFFEEYNAQTPFVGEFPRPVPKFVNHDLGEFDSIIAGRKQCLLQLGREKEAEAAAAQRAVIEIIENEGKQLTKKYWEIEEEEDYD
ncbi:MAG: hypothetical protein FWE67_01730 [Planctomycetaceae bacterium]|nr:hypothetical protein [Planctomycetaceae bacterium]